MPLPWLIGAVAIASAAAARAVVEEKKKEQEGKELDVTALAARPANGSLPSSLNTPTSTPEREPFALEGEDITLGEDTPFTELGQRVATTRKLLGMHQDECAKAAKISRTALRNLESGKDTKLSTLYAVSAAINVPVFALIQEMQPRLEQQFLEKVKSKI